MSAMPALAPEKYSYGTSWADIFGRPSKKSKYSSFKEFILKNQDMSKGRMTNPPTAECGFTAPDKQKPQALPDKLEWYGGQQNHPGPCETWCNDELVLPFTPSCQATYPDGKFPYNKSKCVSKKRLSFYWMATLMEWQVYIQCINIGGNRSMHDDDGVPSSYNFTSIDQQYAHQSRVSRRVYSMRLVSIYISRPNPDRRRPYLARTA